MSKLSLSLTSLVLFSLSGFGLAAGLKGSDATIKQKLLGYWDSPRHGYLVKANGIKYMLVGTTTNKWDVRNGVYYEDGEAYDIIMLTQQKFVCRSRKDRRITFELERVSYEAGEKLRLSDPENTVPPPDPQPGITGGNHDTNQRRIGAATAATELAAADAARHIGQNATVSGVVTNVDQSRAHLHMGLGGTPENPDMYVFVPSYGETDIFPDYFKYRGATITVSGRIQRRNGHLGIDVTDPSQIVAKTEGLTDHAHLGHMKQKRGDLDGAIAEFDLAIKQDPQDANALRERASVKAEKGDAEGAITDYNRCIELSPNDSIARWARARLKSMMGDFDAALADYDQVIQTFPRWGEAYNQRAEGKKAKGDITGALADYEAALQADPSNATYRANLQKAQAPSNRKQPLTAAASTPHSSVAAASPPSQNASKAISAEIIDIPPGQAAMGIKAGNIRVTFSDGHVANQTYAGNCSEPHVSGNGLVGWVKCNGFDPKGYPLDEKVVVGTPNGFMKQFAPDPRFVEQWAFAENDSAIVMRCRGYHGAATYIRYDLATGRVTNRGGGNDANPAPQWARAVAQE